MGWGVGGSTGGVQVENRPGAANIDGRVVRHGELGAGEAVGGERGGCKTDGGSKMGRTCGQTDSKAAEIEMWSYSICVVYCDQELRDVWLTTLSAWRDNVASGETVCIEETVSDNHPRDVIPEPLSPTWDINAPRDLLLPPTPPTQSRVLNPTARYDE